MFFGLSKNLGKWKNKMSKQLCFEIIEACPNQCIFCSSLSCISKEKIISFETFKRTIDYFQENTKIEEVSLSGGEPFLHPELFQMIKYLKEKEIPSIIFTSGVKKSRPRTKEEISDIEQRKRNDINEVKEHEPWNERLIRNLEKYYDQFLKPKEFGEISKEEFLCLKNLGLQKVVFDFQGYKEETDEYLMGRKRSMRDALLDSILNASRVGLFTEVHFIPMKPNYKEIVELLELLEIPKVNSVHILDFVPQGRGKQNEELLSLSVEEYQEFLKYLEEGSKVFSGTIYLGTSLKKEHHCTAGLQKIHIKYDGTILPCAAFKEFTKEEYKSLGIPICSIYGLEEYKIPKDGVRKEALCKKVYRRKEI